MSFDAMLMSVEPLVMGILNVTPDSFSDGGKFFDHDKAIARGLEMIEEGVDIVDIGGESSRPGATRVPEEEELRRVLPGCQRVVCLGQGFDRYSKACSG
jgi:Dihydropteroate synthase (EC 2.5.1.15)